MNSLGQGDLEEQGYTVEDYEAPGGSGGSSSRSLVLPAWTASGSGAPARVSPLQTWQFTSPQFAPVQRREGSIPTWAMVAAGGVALSALLMWALKE